MNKYFPVELKTVFVIPIGLGIVLIPFTFLIGWTLATVVLFWFVILPSVAVFLSTKTTQRKVIRSNQSRSSARLWYY